LNATFGSHGLDINKMLFSAAGNDYSNTLDNALGNLTWMYLTYGDNSRKFPGWYLQDPRQPYLPCGAGQINMGQGKYMDGAIDMVNTMFSIFGVVHHNWGFYNLSYSFEPYTNMFKWVHLDESYEFWSNARYMKRNTVNAYATSNTIVLEYKANSTLEDYVWQFPLKYNGKYFQGFTDNRTVGKIQHVDGEYVYIEFASGGNEKITATYGDNPHIHKLGHYVENTTETYTANNLQLTLWNATSEPVKVEVNCTILGQPYSVKYANGTSINFNYNTATKICDFNVSFASPVTVNVAWAEDTTPPSYSGLSYSTTLGGSSCTFKITWQDNVGLSHYIFSWNFGEGWQNTTTTAFTSNPQTVSVTKTLPAAGTTVSFRWYANDTSNNWGDTGTRTFTTTSPSVPGGPGPTPPPAPPEEVPTPTPSLSLFERLVQALQAVPLSVLTALLFLLIIILLAARRRKR